MHSRYLVVMTCFFSLNQRYWLLTRMHCIAGLKADCTNLSCLLIFRFVKASDQITSKSTSIFICSKILDSLYPSDLLLDPRSLISYRDRQDTKESRHWWRHSGWTNWRTACFFNKGCLPFVTATSILCENSFLTGLHCVCEVVWRCVGRRGAEDCICQIWSDQRFQVTSSKVGEKF